MTDHSRVRVDLGSRGYDIRIAAGSLSEAGAIMTAWLKTQQPAALRTLIVADGAIVTGYAARVEQSLRDAGADVRMVAIPSGESSKSFAETQRLYDVLVAMQADRRTAVIAVGGGVTGDLAGFAAATWARGIPFIQVPTTLLAMVDSSVGGKTGINHPHGKNLIGAFHQPSGVLIDPDTLATLPDRDYRSGLAEVVKYGVILDAGFFDWLEAHTAELNQRQSAALEFIIRRSCELKAQVVQEDEFETTGLRAVLNYGHTFAHAFETLAGYGTLLHGEAVAIGMVCASRLAESLQRITSVETARQKAMLDALGLPVTVPADLIARADDIVDRMLLDKKTQNRELRFILPARIGKVELVSGVSPALAIAALAGD